ncbi:MAG: hypothetical protein MJE77_28175, partial [Proteobacteria bacterium]|nr:hypothetical protein [Pseudomonadota bacterium]
LRAGPKTLRVARAAIHHRQRACSSVKYSQYSPLLAHPLAARLVALARSEIFGPALKTNGEKASLEITPLR